MEQSISTTSDRTEAGHVVLRRVVTRRLQQLRRYIWLVAAITLLAFSVSAYLAFSAADSYTAKSALVVSSPGRAPEEDAVLAVGYATLFNDPATISRLRASKAVPADVAFEAKTAAASPIVTIAATAATAKTAQDAAQVMAEAFRDDINAVRKRETDAAIVDLQRQLDQLRSQSGPNGDPSIGVLQDRIDKIRSDSTNQLQDLQLRVGAVRNPPPVVFTLSVGLIGGLLAGALAAFALAALSSRLTSVPDVRDKAGIETLVEMPGGTSGRSALRDARLRTLANALSARSMLSTLAVALTDTRGVHGTQQIAEALAVIFAQQGRRTVLVFTDTESESDSAGSAGFNEALRESHTSVTMLKRGGVDSLSILAPGTADVDRYSMLTRHRIDAVIDQLRTVADVIIVAAPPLSQGPQSEIICAAADTAVLVISKKVSRVEDAVSAEERLASVGATVAGAILLEDEVSGLPSIPIRGVSPARHRPIIADVAKV